MKIVKIFENEIALQGDIQTATALRQNEIVILSNKGEVLLYSLESHQLDILFETNPPKGVQYADGGFDPMAASSIYVMEDIIVVVNDYKKHGFVLNRKDDYLVHFTREDYHANISKYPIALFKSETGEPHLIFGVAWNHLQIVNLATRQLITAAKSLIEQNAEEKHTTFYKEHKEHNKLFWPTEYDYFFGELMMSPNSEKFLSAGWVWGSFDCYKVYDLLDFVHNHRIKDESVCFGNHESRGVCFVDNQTIAAVFHPYAEEEENSSPSDPSEIRLFGMDGQDEIGKIILKISADLTKARLFYHAQKKIYIALSEKIGLIAIAQDGSIALHDPALIPQQYDKTFGMFLCYEENRMTIYQIENLT